MGGTGRPHKSPPVPGTLDEVTAGWLDAALAEGGVVAAAVATVDVAPLGPAVGLLGDLARLRVSYRTGHGPPSMIVKVPTANPGGHRVGSMLGAWAREVAFYREVAPASPGADVPRCYHAAADPDRGRWVVVLEDVPSDPVDGAAGATEEQAMAAVEALARFHATWWNDPRRFAWMPGFDRAGGVGGLQGSWLEAIPVFLERFGHVVPAPTGAWLRAFAPTLGRWSARSATEPLTIVHADYRLDNLLVADGRVTMIDWQTALRGPGAMDLTSFVATSLTVEARRRSEDGLIARYLEVLASRGIVVDEAWFARSYDENLLWWMGQFANNLARLEPETDAIRRSLDTMIERTYTAALDRDVGRLIER
ncbi:MAG: phosphotransferase [Acidimicrobiales bacterium]